MRGLVKVALAIAAVLLVVVVFLVLHDFDAPELGQKVAAAVKDATGVDLQAKSFRLNLARGLELEGVVAKRRAPRGNGFAEPRPPSSGAPTPPSPARRGRRRAGPSRQAFDRGCL
jgi:hypothetical protein